MIGFKLNLPEVIGEAQAAIYDYDTCAVETLKVGDKVLIWYPHTNEPLGGIRYDPNSIIAAESNVFIGTVLKTESDRTNFMTIGFRYGAVSVWRKLSQHFNHIYKLIPKSTNQEIPF